MNVKNDLTIKYSKGIIYIHWISALLILILFPLGKYTESLALDNKLLPLTIHAILGLTVFVLTIIRIFFYFKYPRPPRLKTGSKFNDKLIVRIENSFYYLIVMISIFGILAMTTLGYGNAIKNNDISLIIPHKESFFIESHNFFATILMIFFVFHVFGVIKHKILTKENTLKRITFLK